MFAKVILSQYISPINLTTLLPFQVRERGKKGFILTYRLNLIPLTTLIFLPPHLLQMPYFPKINISPGKNLGVEPGEWQENRCKSVTLSEQLRPSCLTPSEGQSTGLSELPVFVCFV
ncbi:unnamed protein product [Pipistrellus nathusii]|uniref:Uncharacterized protein n=1 Tax=Pipistrellus nathusii TaxID=59473 RepID=A0ABP0A3Z3_PIPNA